MAEKIYDYSNKKSYDGVSPRENEALVPFLAHEILKNYHDDLKDGLIKPNQGLIEKNFETWTIRGRKILVGFVAIPKDQVGSYMKRLWQEKDEYLESLRKKRCLIPNGKGEFIRCPKCNDCNECKRPDRDMYLSRYISLDKLMEDNDSDDTSKSGWDPAAPSSLEDTYFTLSIINDLIEEVALKYPEAKVIFPLLMKDPQIKNVLNKVNLNKDKSQSYAYVRKMQKYAKEIFDEKYR